MLANSAANPAQIPLPCDPISSDSDSNYNMSTQQSTNPDIASVEQHNQTKPPMLTSGKVSAQVLQDFSEGCESYFFHKDITPDKQVSAIIMGIKDHWIKDWYCANKALVAALTFDNLMTQLHTRLLKEGWKNTLQSDILSTAQGKKPFNDWKNSLGAQNSLFLGSTSHIPKQQLHNHLNVNMHSNTKTECDKKRVHDEPLFALWVEKVSVIDTRCLCDIDKHTCLVDDAIKCSKNILMGPSTCGNKQTGSSSPTTTFQPSGSILAKLLNMECTLLNTHEGCTKCRRFYVNHCAKDCPNGFPTATGYKPLTDAMAVTTKRSKGGKKMTVAAIIDEPQGDEDDDDLVAGVGMSSSVIGNSTDSESDEYMSPPPEAPLAQLFCQCPFLI